MRPRHRANLHAYIKLLTIVAITTTITASASRAADDDRLGAPLTPLAGPKTSSPASVPVTNPNVNDLNPILPEGTTAFSNLSRGDGLGFRSEFVAVGTPVPAAEARPLAPVKPPEPAGGPPISLIAGLVLLTVLGGTMWYLVRQRSQ